MNERLIELYVQRGRLHERISAQRGQLARELAPLGVALQAVDRTQLVLHQARVWMLAHPGVVGVAVVALLVWRPRAVVRSARWAFSAWGRWSRLRGWMRAIAR